MEEHATLIQKSKDSFNSNRRLFRFTSPTHTDVFIDYSNWVAASWYPPVKKDKKKKKKSLKMISSQQQYKQQQLKQQRQTKYLLNTIQALLMNMAGFKLLVASIALKQIYFWKNIHSTKKIDCLYQIYLQFDVAVKEEGGKSIQYQ
jgi:hypothetical protein